MFCIQWRQPSTSRSVNQKPDWEEHDGSHHAKLVQQPQVVHAGVLQCHLGVDGDNCKASSCKQCACQTHQLEGNL